MIIKHKEQRVAIFIDAQNLYHSAKHLYDDSRVNFANILADTVADRKLIRAMAYVISTKTGEESSFFEALGKIGIETRSKELQEFWGGAKKGDWDVGLAVDAITIAPKLDAIIIASGDGDFVPLVESRSKSSPSGNPHPENSEKQPTISMTFPIIRHNISSDTRKNAVAR